MIWINRTPRYLRMYLLLLAATFAASMGIFTLSYRYDNKYRLESCQPIGGILLFPPLEHRAANGTVNEAANGAAYLINGWQYYKNRLLTPEDFRHGPLPPDQYVAIGQYSGMEAGDPDASPHGSATYRLILSLPQESASYTLELPEIYSAYQLYIGGRLMASQGNPQPGQYEARLHSGTLTFEAAGDTEVLLAVSDWSHLYSGLVYPPAFGSPETVASLLDARFAWCLAMTVLALVLGLFQAALSLILKNKQTALSGMICLFFAGSVCSPVIHRLFTTGIVPFYPLEIFCRYAVYGTSLLLVQFLCGRNSLAEKTAASIAILFPAMGLAVSLCAPGLSYQSMLLFSRMTGMYKAICALWILGTAFLSGLKREESQSPILLAGCCIFASSLAADRIYPLFEPIRFGWFSEIAGFLFVLILSFLLLRDSARLYRRQLILNQQKEQMAQQIVRQKAHYSELATQMESIRVMRHDMHHHLAQLALLLEEQSYEEAGRYLHQLNQGALPTSPLSFCQAYHVDVLLRYYYAKAEDLQLPMTVNANLPQDPGIPEEDLCVILGNVLENALDACKKVPPGQRCLSVSMTCKNGGLGIEVKNSYLGSLIPDGENFLSSKGHGRHGIGLSSVRATAEKYSGNVWVRTEEGSKTDNQIHTFIILILLMTSEHPSE